MNTNTKKKTSASLSSQVQRIVSTESANVTVAEMKNITKKNIEDLKLLIRKRSTASPMHLRRSIVAIAAAEQSEEVAKLLSTVVKDTSVTSADRIVAAIKLGDMPGKYSESALLKSLPSVEPIVQCRILQTLGAVGTKKALTALSRLPEPEDAFTGKQLRFARELIVHRLGIKNTEKAEQSGTVWEPGDPSTLKKMPITQLKPEQIRTLKKQLRSHLYGVELSDEIGYRISVENTPMFLVLNRKFTGEKGIDGIVEKPSILGLFIRVNNRTGEPAVHQLMFASPSGRSVVIRSFRTDGTLQFDGKATKGGFLINGSDTAGRCRYRLEGVLQPDKVVWKKRERSLGKLRKRTTVSA